MRAHETPSPLPQLLPAPALAGGDCGEPGRLRDGRGPVPVVQRLRHHPRHGLLQRGAPLPHTLPAAHAGEQLIIIIITMHNIINIIIIIIIIIISGYGTIRAMELLQRGAPLPHTLPAAHAGQEL
jgi:hypothetical protein